MTRRDLTFSIVFAQGIGHLVAFVKPQLSMKNPNLQSNSLATVDLQDSLIEAGPKQQTKMAIKAPIQSVMPRDYSRGAIVLLLHDKERRKTLP